MSKIPAIGDRIVGDVNGTYNNGNYHPGDHWYVIRSVNIGQIGVSLGLDDPHVRHVWYSDYITWLEEEQFWTFRPGTPDE